MLDELEEAGLRLYRHPGKARYGEIWGDMGPPRQGVACVWGVVRREGDAGTARPRALGLADAWGSCRLDVESRGSLGRCPTTDVCVCVCVWRS